jgi:hypothetical protein
MPGLPECHELPVSGSLAGWVWEIQQPVLFENIERAVDFSRVMQVLRGGVQSTSDVPDCPYHEWLFSPRLMTDKNTSIRQKSGWRKGKKRK